MDINQDTLTSVTELLDEKGVNYTVFLGRYMTPSMPGTSSEQLIRDALGTNAVSDEIREVTPLEVLTEVESALRYEGDASAGPSAEAMRSERFEELLSDLLSEITAAAGKANRIEQFWLREGHPAYPVFWDFAFLFTGPTKALVLIGSSSD